MNQNQPLTSSQPSDDGTVHFELNHEPTSTTPANPTLTRSNNFVDETETGLFDFDLEDLENLFNTATQTANSTAHNALSLDSEPQITPAVTAHNEPSDGEHFLTLDKDMSYAIDNPNNADLDKMPDTYPSTSEHKLNQAAIEPVISQPTTPLTETTSEIYQSAVMPNPSPASDDFTISDSHHTADTALMATTAATTAVTAATVLSAKTTEPVTPIPPSPTIDPLPANSSPTVPVSPLPITKKPAKNNKPLLLLLAILLLGALAWLASHLLADPESTPTTKAAPAVKAPTPVATDSPTSASIATTAPSQANSATAVTPPTQTATSATVATHTAASATSGIKPEEILSAPLPKDDAIAKEEIDRLADQSKQLSQQEKMKEEQLKMMNELASKKEERIAILEKQIAQAEAQKAQGKK